MHIPIITLATYGTDLSSRVRGVAVRSTILAALDQGAPRVCVDCTGVRTLSASFADEVFGILVATYGKPWFREHIAVTGLTEFTRSAILLGVADRLEHPSPI